MRSSMVVAVAAATIGCAFDYESNPTLAKRALLNGGPGTPLNSARSAWGYPVKFGA